MDRVPVIAIFDVGKTNKKLFLFDRQYRIVYEKGRQLAETIDEDGFPCEDLQALTAWVLDSWRSLFALPGFEIRAVNFSAYGASFIHLDKEDKACTALYNYLKPYPPKLKEGFYETYGPAGRFALATASPMLGHLNSGMQLYWLKHEHPEIFSKIACSLHLPQYLSWLLTGRQHSDITSVGCHTNLWDYTKKRYHEWVAAEHIDTRLAPLREGTEVTWINEGQQVAAGFGLHDSSAALIPYLARFSEPFILLSTGTWCISLNPFNQTPLTVAELEQDCLCYLSFQGKQVKASRLFAGQEHEEQTKRIAAAFKVPDDFYATIKYDDAFLHRPADGHIVSAPVRSNGIVVSAFGHRDLASFSSATEAYHQLIMDIMELQVASIRLVLDNSPVKKLFVDGGFGKNPVFMSLLAAAFPGIEVFAASVAQASALGAALAIHSQWNAEPVHGDLIDLQLFAS